jgi:hypothetical protein
LSIGIGLTLSISRTYYVKQNLILIVVLFLWHFWLAVPDKYFHHKVFFSSTSRTGFSDADWLNSAAHERGKFATNAFKLLFFSKNVLRPDNRLISMKRIFQMAESHVTE